MKHETHIEWVLMVPLTFIMMSITALIVCCPTPSLIRGLEVVGIIAGSMTIALWRAIGETENR